MRGFQLRNFRRLYLTGAVRSSQPSRFLCASANTNNVNNSVEGAKSIRDFDAYKQLDKLDFMTAAKILFTAPPKKKKFGLDFHLVQLFFACMPSLAVYLVAQYARHEIRRMEAEEEVKKKKAEEEEKAKQMEALAIEEEKRRNDPELLQVKERLDALEQTLKGIVVEAKKTPDDQKPTVETKPISSAVKCENNSNSGSSTPGPNPKSVSGSDLVSNEQGKVN